MHASKNSHERRSIMNRFLRSSILAAGLACFLANGVSAQSLEILGAGATFPYPLYSKMFYVYDSVAKVKINYQSIGSGGGILQLQNKTVDFGASDAFLNDKQLGEMPSPVVHIPMCLGAVTVTYNLPGNPVVKLTPEVLSGIYLGKIKKWNAPEIAAVNNDIKLPNSPIVVVHRSDGSGTTFIFTDYLAKVSSEWKETVGADKSVKWPAGLGAKGNEGVSGMVKQMPGSIGYCELAYTKQNKMPQAVLENSSKEFITPSLESTSLAAGGNMPEDTRISMTNTSAKGGYPIAGFTWIILYKDQNYNQRTKEKAKATVDLLWWMIHEGQQYTKPLDYAPLPAGAVKKAEIILKSVTFDGKPLL